MIARTFLRRILLRSLMVAGFTALVTWLIVYQLVSRTSLERALDDSQMAAAQTRIQLSAFFDHVRYSAIEVIVEPDVRRTLLAFESENPRLSYEQHTLLRRRLRLLAATRPYMHSMAVLDLSGHLYWSFIRPDEVLFDVENPDEVSSAEDLTPSVEEPTDDEDSLPSAQSVLGELPLTRLQTSFTERYLVTASDAPVEVFGMVVPVRGLEEAERHFGYLIVNIHVHHMRSVIRGATVQFDGYVWLDDRQRVVDSLGVPERLLEAFSEHPDRIPPVYGAESGRVVVIDGFGPDWQLLLYSSNRALQEQSRQNALLQAIFTLGALMLLLGLLAPSMAGLVRPIHNLAEAMQRVSQGDLDVQVPVAGGQEMSRLTDGFNRMTDDLRVHIESRIRYEHEVKRMEYDLLAAQVNPHFIYNTLNSVIYLARQERSADISTMVSSLISILQDTLRISADAVLDTLDSELRMAWHYLQIQRYRCGDMYSAKWDVDPDLKQLLVPRSIVQPLVENALFHGILPTGRVGTLEISAQRAGDLLRVCVRDSGEGMPADVLENVRRGIRSAVGPASGEHGDRMKSIGLRNIYMRLTHIYGDDFSMAVDSEAGSGTTVELLLPLVRQPERLDA